MGTSSCPTISRKTVRCAGVQAVEENFIDSTPDDHFGASPHGGVTDSCRWRAVSTSARPAVCGGVVFPAHARNRDRIPTPDDHFTPCPHGGVRPSQGWCIDSAGSAPTVCRRTISSPRVRTARGISFSTPHDHLISSPYCCMKVSGIRSTGNTSRCPSVRRGIYLPLVLKLPRPPQIIISVPVQTAV